MNRNQEAVKKRIDRKVSKRVSEKGQRKQEASFGGKGYGRKKGQLVYQQYQAKRSVPQYVRGVPRIPQRSVEKALQKVYGVGRVKAVEVCRACGIRPKVKVGNMKVEYVQLVERWRMENRVCGSDRRRIEHESIQRHMNFGTVRGTNLRRGLPVRGQRTSTNGITARKLNGLRGSKRG
jgi:small subunit ribosomal protein S13